MLEIWGRQSSSNVQALMWCVGELDLPYTRHDAGLSYGVTDTPGFAEMNPNRTVPVLRDGDSQPLWETGAILRYLATSYGDDAFWPTAPLQRAEVDKWADWAKINVAMVFGADVFRRVVRTPQADRDADGIAASLATLNAALAIAERRLDDQTWLAGADFTLADIPFGQVLYRYFDIEISRPAWPSLRRYFDRLMERPAYREPVALSYDELRA